jgi:hypothetical protein
MQDIYDSETSLSLPARAQTRSWFASLTETCGHFFRQDCRLKIQTGLWYTKALNHVKRFRTPKCNLNEKENGKAASLDQRCSGCRLLRPNAGRRS